MRKDVITTTPLKSSFLSVEQDTLKILKKLFIDTKPYSDILKRLLVINTPDCLDTSISAYQEAINSLRLEDLIRQGYVRIDPKIYRKEFENIKSYIVIIYNSFTKNSNPEFKDGILSFNVVCYNDEWTLDDFQIRPLKICGYIDGIINDYNQNVSKRMDEKTKLSGVGRYNFIGCEYFAFNEDISMYSLSYKKVHFSDDYQYLGEAIY